jgi:hypothetical protein
MRSSKPYFSISKKFSYRTEKRMGLNRFIDEEQLGHGKILKTIGAYRIRPNLTGKDRSRFVSQLVAQFADSKG